MRVYLTGFMGAGKSVVGSILAERLAVPFVDLDEQIERSAGRSVSEIFERDGEPGFRRLERQALLRTADLPEAVIATGAGAFADRRNRDWMRQSGCVVWLRAPFATLAKRVDSDRASRRPLFRDVEAAEALYRKRQPAYAEAEIVVDADDGTAPGSLADAIREKLGR